jgi:hypothetical protein
MTMKWPDNPRIYEINTWTWLDEMSSRYGRPITLGNIPSEEWDREIDDIDAIWLMGVWERSPRGREIAAQHPGLLSEYVNSLADFEPDDVVGSPYSVRRYRVDSRLGGPEGLATARAQLADRGWSLLLDFVPNHVATDHPWTQERPICFIHGTDEDLLMQPDRYFRSGTHIYAHGRDPYFPSWTDTAQLNAFAPDARKALHRTLLEIASQCDGVRCDMAMLLTNEVFGRTWQQQAGTRPVTDFWREIIPAVKRHDREFLFVAEVYWDLEWELQQQGFDYCYDKRLYDRLVHENADSVRAHLAGDITFQNKLIRFIENHDEPRAAAALGERSRAAAVLTLTLPGAKLVHQGQTRGHQIKTPVQLGRRAVEWDDPGVMSFYKRALEITSHSGFRNNSWRLCRWEAEEVKGNLSDLIVTAWETHPIPTLIVVNFGETEVRCRLAIDGVPALAGRRITDLLSGESWTQDNRIVVQLSPWSGRILV